MRVLVVSKFLHHVGGVETYLQWQVNALHAAGHSVGLLGMQPPAGHDFMSFPDVQKWTVPTRSFEAGAEGRFRSAALSVWSWPAGAVLKRALREFLPDVVHYHGICYQLTPAVVRPAMMSGIPLFITAHEYKLICANQTLFDDLRQNICTACVGLSAPRKASNTLRRSCMKGSRGVSALGAAETLISSAVWKSADPFIFTPSRFMCTQLIADGWNAERLAYLDLPWRGRSDAVGPSVETDEPDSVRDQILFVGRLVPLKGVQVLLRAWSLIASRHPDISVSVVGEGVYREGLQALVNQESIPRVHFHGAVPLAQVKQHLARAIVTAHPSQWFENSPYTVRESLMAGVPAIVANTGGMAEMVSEGSGWSVAHDDVEAWSRALEDALRRRLAGSTGLRTAVLSRAMTDEEHLERLLAAYVEHSRLHGGKTVVG